MSVKTRIDRHENNRCCCTHSHRSNIRTSQWVTQLLQSRVNNEWATGLFSRWIKIVTGVRWREKTTQIMMIKRKEKQVKAVLIARGAVFAEEKWRPTRNIPRSVAKLALVYFRLSVKTSEKIYQIKINKADNKVERVGKRVANNWKFSF